jgi:hypothetical protein
MSTIDVVAAGAEGAGNHRGDAEPGSVLASLRSRAARQREAKRLDLAVGGSFGDLLRVRYRPLPVDELERYSELTGRIGNIALAIDMMVSCCETVLWHEHGDDTVLGVRLDADLWELLDWPLPDGVEDASELVPRDLVEALFGDNAMALGQHAERLIGWMMNTEELAPGEAPAATS